MRDCAVWTCCLRFWFVLGFVVVAVLLFGGQVVALG